MPNLPAHVLLGRHVRPSASAQRALKQSNALDLLAKISGEKHESNSKHFAPICAEHTLSTASDEWYGTSNGTLISVGHCPKFDIL